MAYAKLLQDVIIIFHIKETGGKEMTRIQLSVTKC